MENLMESENLPTTACVMDETFSSNGILLDIEATRREYDEDLNKITKYRRLADYLAASQLYLKDNFFLERPLQKDNIKERILGHWGTCPGISFAYAHCSYLIKKHDINMMMVVGPGHGAPAVFANFLMEGAFEKSRPELTPDKRGMEKLIKNFCWPGGHPSHVNSEFPGTIHEGGELGYALSVSFGAVMDNPDLIATCIVGDGECETGPTATSWHSYKFLDPKESGAVLPIIHLNGWKISTPTIYGCTKTEDLVSLFNGMGYKVRFVEDMNDIEADMATSMEWALREIRKIQHAAREGHPMIRPKWPLLILRTPKGWGGVKVLHGKQVEGTYRSHGIPIQDPKGDEESFMKLEEWLRSYKVEELFDESGNISKEILSIIPSKDKIIGNNKHTNPTFEPLDTPNPLDHGVRECDKSGICFVSPTMTAASYITETIRRNPNRFRIFSPDELESNKLEAVFQVTNRNFQLWEDTANKGGRVTEVLSEHMCQGWMQGYSLTGRYSLFPSYETFLGIITTMMIQYAKFRKLATQTKWRNDVPSINYISTSTLWRQEHNGYSHQDPMFINSILNMKSNLVRVYFPPDANCCVYVLDKALNRPNRINLIVSTKAAAPVWLTPQEAKEHCDAGVGIWKWISSDEGVNPDVVIVGCGNETNVEALSAVSLLRSEFPGLRIRFVNVIDLMILDINREQSNPCALTVPKFEEIFTADKPVVFNFHGYPSAISQLLFGRTKTRRIKVLGYIEEGTTTTPFAMLTSNGASRFHVAIEALKMVACSNVLSQDQISRAISGFENQLMDHERYIRQYGKDPEYLSEIISAPKSK